MTSFGLAASADLGLRALCIQSSSTFSGGSVQYFVEDGINGVMKVCGSCSFREASAASCYSSFRSSRFSMCSYMANSRSAWEAWPCSKVASLTHRSRVAASPACGSPQFDERAPQGLPWLGEHRSGLSGLLYLSSMIHLQSGREGENEQVTEAPWRLE